MTGAEAEVTGKEMTEEGMTGIGMTGEGRGTGLGTGVNNISFLFLLDYLTGQGQDQGDAGGLPATGQCLGKERREGKREGREISWEQNNLIL